MSFTVIGTCSLCGGNVVRPTRFHSVIPPIPECKSCGATKKRESYIIEMEPRQKSKSTELPSDLSWPHGVT